MAMEKSELNVKGKCKTIDTVSFNGKYIDINIIKRRIISAIAIIGGLAFACDVIFL